MAFSNNYYYDIVLLWIDLYKKESDTHLKELFLRNILSRAYYTMLLHCREQHTDDPQLTFDIMKGSHEQIIELVKKSSIKSLLFNYKLSRKRADYFPTPLSMPIRTIESRKIDLTNIDTIKTHMSEILEYQFK